MNRIRTFVDSFKTKPSETPTNLVEISKVNFLIEVPNIDSVKEKIIELPASVRNLPWQLVLTIDQNEDGSKNSMSLILYCNYDNANSWSCDADVHLKLLSFKTVAEPYRRQLKHCFEENQRTMHFEPFITWSELMEPRNSYERNGKIMIEMIMECEEPKVVSWNSKKHTGFVGMENKIENSFINSIIQILYCIESFRTSITSLSNEMDSTILATKLVFLELQSSEEPVDIDALLESIGKRYFTTGSADDSSNFFLLLKQLLKKESATKQISHLFRAEVSMLSSTSGKFAIKEFGKLYGLNLKINGTKNIDEALDKYFTLNSCRDQTNSSFFHASSWIEVTTLYRWFYGLVRCTNPYDGDTQSDLNVENNLEITRLPPILILHLYRENIGVETANTSIDTFQFYTKIDISKCVKCVNLSTKYVLHAVLVRKERFSAFINIPNENGWLHFDNDIVSHCTEHEAIDENFRYVQMLVYLQCTESNTNEAEDKNVIKFTCIICLETTKKTEQFSTVCGHVFCGPCIKKEISLRQKCPICKNDLAERDIHPIYI